MRRGTCVIALWLTILATGLLCLPARVAADEVDRDAYDVARVAPSQETQTSLIIIAHPRNREVRGTIVSLDSGGITLETKEGEAIFPWAEVSPTSAFFTYMKLIDHASARDWLELAAFARGVGAERQAEQSLSEAIKRDEALADEARRIRQLPLGGLRQPSLELDPPTDDPTTRTALADLPDPPPAEDKGAAQPPKYLPATPEEHAAAIERAKQAADDAGRRLGVRFRLIETTHFLVFTDWPASDDAFLTQTLEEAYRLVAREFDIPWEENVFVGKLPVYMFAHHPTFMQYAREIDSHDDFRDTVAGYFRSRSDGLGKLIMSTPRQARDMGLTMARQVWARTLTHEFTHAFIARYRSNGFIPRWLNEGLAEMISEQVHPDPDAMRAVRRIARRNISIAPLFDDSHMPPAEMYPVMQSLVEALYRENPRAFVTMIDRIKAGEEAQQVLRDLYGVDYLGLERAWRQHMMLN